MAEKGVIVGDATTGESVACRDAMQDDDDSNSRIIQLVDKAARPVDYQLTTKLRDGVATSDSFDLDPIPAAIKAATVDVTDAESCVLWAVVTVGPSTPNTTLFVVTPLVLTNDEDNDLVTLLPPIQIRPVYPKKMANSTIVSTDILHLGQSEFPTILNVFPTFGAAVIGFHVMKSGGDSGASIDLYAEPSSCGGRNAAIDQDIMDDTWGTAFYDGTGGG